MFNHFVTFTEVIKLSPTIYYQLQYIEPDNEIIKSCFRKQDLNSIINTYDRIEDKSLIIELLLFQDNIKIWELEWVKFYYRVAIENFDLKDKRIQNLMSDVIYTFVNYSQDEEIKVKLNNLFRKLFTS